jgi:Type I phosphodiesterase / nucleotide pyrophosphatase
MRRILIGIFVLAFPPALHAEPPKLAVLVVFDQMRGDYLERWRDLFAAGGFRRLQTDGAWFSNCHYPYAMTATGPGHASILSGCSGDRHGIVANNWYDRQAAEAVYCASSPRYERIPPLAKVVEPDPRKDRETEDEKKPKGVGAPLRMLAPTLGDVVKEATHGRGKVFGLSLKDRSALLPVGQRPDGCYWFEKGLFCTSTYYGDRLHPWVAKFNAEHSFDRWYGRSWDRLRPQVDYARYSGPDQVVGEGKGANQGVAFPHPMGTAKKLGSEYYTALANSPFGNEMLLELACRAIDAEKLGQRDATDLLTISFSSNDLIGHCWGPDSQEVLDVTLRSDLIMRDLLTFLDDKVGKGNYVLALTADHGVCPLPENLRLNGHEAQRIVPLGMLTEAELHLRDVFGKPGELKSRWIEFANDGGIYLNRRLIAARGLELDHVARELAKWLGSKPHFHAAYTQRDLATDPSDEIGKRVRKSFMADRSGDVLVVPKIYHLLTSVKTGTTHGTPHPYDTHVPLITFGPGIKGGKRTDAVTPQAIAAILARAIGMAPPAKAEAPVPSGLFGE